MASIVGDSREQFVIDWSPANTYQDVMEADAALIKQMWMIQNFITLKDVQDNWKKGCDPRLNELAGGSFKKWSRETNNSVTENKKRIYEKVGIGC